MGAGASTNGVESVAKANGDEAFRNRDYLGAIVHYTEVIEAASQCKEKFDLFESAVVFSNRSAAFYLCGQYENALADGATAVELLPKWPKGYFRMSRALEKLDRFIEAQDNLLKAQALAPEDKTVNAEVEKLRDFIAKNVTATAMGCTFSWGLGSTHALGHPDPSDKFAPTNVLTLGRKHVVDVSCGAMHSVAVVGTGEVYSWGNNKYGQVGVMLSSRQKLEHNSVVMEPRLIAALIGVHVKAVSCGAGHTVACSSDGRVFSWGVGQQGQLGHKNLESVYEPQQITSLMNEKYNVSAVACGIAHTFFLTDNGRLLACGQNIYGALGMNTMAEAVLIPTCVELNFEAHIVHISCGGAHTAVVDALGRLYTAGSNTCGQLGLGNFNDSCAHFSQVTSFVLDVPIEANRAYDTVKIYDENKKLPLCAYVCCGEEFTVVITQDHFVFTVGLGLGGQLGLASNPDKLNTFHQVSTLDGKNIEEISCSQSAVFAISSNGDVYNWGIFSDKSLSQHHSKEDVKIIPIRNSAFKKRKRARQIACGRNHFILLTIAPYGPLSELIVNQLPKEQMFSDTNEDCEQNNSCAIAVEAGKLFKFVIQSKDIKGENVDFGGCSYHGVVTNLLQNNASQWEDFSNPSHTNVEIDDCFDGKYHGDCRFFTAGEYSLSVTLDSLHIKGSPFNVIVSPSVVHGPSCLVSFNKEHLHRSKHDIGDVNTPEHICAPGELIVVWIKCCDKYSNLFPDMSNTFVVLECKNQDNNIILHECYQFHIDSNSLASLEIESPSERGNYSLTFSIGGMKVTQLLPGDPLRCRVIASRICPSQCEVQAPDSCKVGEAFTVVVVLKDANGTPLPVDADSNPYELCSLLTPSTDYQICSRAIIQFYHSFGEVLTPIRGKLLPTYESPYINFEHVINVAGEADLEISVEGIVVSRQKIKVRPCQTSPLFVELMSAGDALRNWENVHEDRLLIFQCNDEFGNARGVGGDDITITMYLDKHQNDPVRHVHLKCHDQGNGFYDTSVSVIDKDINSLYIMHAKVNGQEIKYSPFSFNNAYRIHEDINVTEDFQKIEELQKERNEANLIKKEKNKIAQIEKANLEKFERLRKQELTKRRAMDGLRNENSKRAKEKEERRLNRIYKRTGGGFIVQFSKDI